MKSYLTVKDYKIEAKEFEIGTHSTIHYAKRTSDNPEEQSCIVKRILKSQANLLYDQLAHEEKYYKEYTKSNATTKFIQRCNTSNNINIFYNYFPSKSLEKMLKEIGVKPLNPQDKKNILKLIIQGLQNLHEIGKAMHRNLNLSHILINKDLNEIKFCGNSTIFYFGQGYPKTPVGPLPFQAPELESGPIIESGYTEKVDIYLLGIVIYKLFQIPYQNEIEKITEEKIDNTENFGKELKDLIKLCILNNPIERPKARDLLNHPFFSSNIIITPKIENPGHSIFHKVNGLEAFPPYQPTGIIYGTGHYSIVYQVKNLTTQRLYALKLINLKGFKHSSEKQLIYGEIDLLKNMINNSYFVRIEEAIENQKDKLILILEDCNGGDLSRYIESLNAKKINLKNDELQLIAWNVAQGLYYLHSKKIVHRDIKPQNILVIKNSNNVLIDAKICDLGLGARLDEGETTYQIVCGTLQFMAPEVRRKGNGEDVLLTFKTDIYSYGLILNFLITGNIPTLAKDNKFLKFPEIYVTLPPNSEANHEIIDLIQKCLNLNPEHRIDFKDIIKHKFFNNIKLGPLQTSKYYLALTENDKVIDGKISRGYVDKTGRYFIKRFNKEFNKIPQQDLEKFIQREIGFLTKMKSIPHIIQLIDYGISEEDNTIVEIFEYCNGESLNHFLSSRYNSKVQNKFSIIEIKIVARCVLEFLFHLHRKNYVHRNINPTHIIIIKDDKEEIKEAKICGLRTSKSESLGSSVSLFYSNDEIMFVDPDVMQSSFYSEISDLWSLGIVIYYMEFGSYPINSQNDLSKLKLSKSLLLPKKDIDKGIENIIKFCTQKREPYEYSSLQIQEFLKLAPFFE